MPRLSVKNASVVLVGVFDVQSFTPMALVGKKIISLTEAIEASAVTVFPGKATSFDLTSLKVSAQSSRVQVEASAPPYIKAADIVSKALRDNQQFPSRVSAIGINLHSYYVLDDFLARDRLGRLLAPLEAWGRWSEKLKEAAKYPPGDPRHSGVVSITMRLPVRDDRESGWIDVKVEPSARQQTIPEIFISVNDHYDLGKPKENGDEPNTAPLALLRVAETMFDASIERSEEIIASILEQAK